MIIPVLFNAVVATTYPLAKVALSYAQPLYMTGLRMVIGGGCLLGLQFLIKRSQFRFSRSHWPLLVQLSLYNILAANVLQFWAMQYVAASKIAFIMNLTPFISAVIAYYLGTEVMTLRKWTGLLIGLVSFVPFVMHNSNSVIANIPYFYVILGQVAVFIAAIFSVLGWLAMKNILARQASTALMANGLSMVIGGLLFAPFVYYMEYANSPEPLIYHMQGFIVLMVIMIIIHNGLNFNGFSYLLMRYPTTLLFFTNLTLPLFALVYGWMFLNEAITWQFVLAMVGVGIGLGLFAREDNRLQAIS